MIGFAEGATTLGKYCSFQTAEWVRCSGFNSGEPIYKFVDLRLMFTSVFISFFKDTHPFSKHCNNINYVISNSSTRVIQHSHNLDI